MRSVLLEQDAGETAASHARAVYPLEACGLLIGFAEDGRLRVTRAIRCPNVVPLAERCQRFEIDPRAYINVQRSLSGSGEHVVGFYHSHPDSGAVPSATDLRYVRLWPETLWLIVPVRTGTPLPPRGWWLEGPESREVREVVLEAPVEARRAAACPG